MRTIINGRVYDTETGTFICNSERGQLFRKYHSQQFFLCSSNTITPIPWNEAKEIIYRNGNKSCYEKLFSTEDDSRRCNVDLSRSDYKKLQEFAGQYGISVREANSIAIAKLWRNRDRHIR